MSHSTAPAKFAYRPEVDGLRALAIVPVVLFHAGVQGWDGGFLGVDVFFVISGYLISKIVLTELAADNFSLGRFYERRIRRILPLYVVVTLATLVGAYFLLQARYVDITAKSLLFSNAFISNLFYFTETGYFNPNADLNPLLHTWSLSVEEQFYILGVPLILALYRVGTTAVIVGLTLLTLFSALLASTLVEQAPAANFYLLTSRAWELGIGALVATYSSRHHPLINNIGCTAGILLICTSIFFFDEHTPHPSPLTFAPVLGTASILVFGTQQTIVGRLLSLKPVVGIGLISYSLYLWHFPILIFPQHMLMGEIGGIATAGLIILAVALSILSWLTIESWFRKKAPRWQLFSFLALLLLLSSALSIHLYFQDGHTSFNRNYPPASLQHVFEYTQDGKACFSRLEKPGTDYCRFQTPESKTPLYLIGDSHAGSLASSFIQQRDASQYDIHDLTIVACHPFDGLFLSGQPEQCSESMQLRRTDILLNAAPGIVVQYARLTPLVAEKKLVNQGFQEARINSFSGPQSAYYLTNNGVRIDTTDLVATAKADYQAFVSKLIDVGHQIVIVYPTPEFGYSVPELFYKSHKFGLESIQLGIRFNEFRTHAQNVYEIYDAAAGDGILRVYPEQLFCRESENWCHAETEGRLFFSDDDHLSPVGADRLADEIYKRIGEVNRR